MKLRDLRKKYGYSQVDLAKKLNVTQSAISQWENGRTMPDNFLLAKLAELYETSIDYLLDNTDNPAPIASLEHKKGIKIPVLGRIQAGIPVEAVEDILDYEEIPAELVQSGAEFFALQVRGDSMEPVLKEKDVVIVQRQADVENGEMAVVLVNGDSATVKKIKKMNTGVMLLPYNPEYEPMFYSNDQIHSLPVVILGKVIELRRKF